jgi:hypothetical protein
LLPTDISTTFPALRTIRLISILLLTLAGISRADIDLPSVPPPQPLPVKARVYLGESVEIPLSAASRSRYELQFIIRRAPESGTLSEIRPSSRNSAVVVYTSDRRAGVGEDRFRYAVRAPGAGVSTPAEVVVTIVERPPVFTAPAQVEFSSVPVGETEVKTFEARNEGGGVLQGQFTVPAPWKVVGDKDYSLGPGETQTFAVAFHPTTDGNFTDSGKFSHGSEITLYGRGYLPVEVVPREVRLEADGHNEARTGEFLLRNVSDTPRELRVVAPPEIVVQDRVSLSARSETRVALHTRAGFLGALQGELVVTGDQVNLRAPLRVMAAPARLEADRTEVDFGELAAGRTGRARLMLKNVGGSPANVTAQAPEGVIFTPDPAGEAIAPGESREFEITYARPSGGKLDDRITFSTGALTVVIPARAVVKEDAAAPLPASTTGDVAAPAASVDFSDIPPVAEIRVQRTKHEIDLSWKKGGESVARYEIVQRRIEFDPDGKPYFKLTRLKDVKVRFVRDEARATIEGLRAGEHVTLLVVGYDANGRPSHPSEAMDIATLPNPPLRIPWGWIGTLVVIVSIALIVRERRRLRAVSDAEFQQMMPR